MQPGPIILIRDRKIYNAISLYTRTSENKDQEGNARHQKK